MENIILIFILTLILNFALLTFNLTRVYADSVSLSISPPIFEVMIRPGKSITQTYVLVNNGEAALITPRLVEYTSRGVYLNAKSLSDTWIKFLNTDISFDRAFFLEKGQKRSLVLRVNPPGGFEQGDYYRAILFTTSENPSIESSQSSINQSIGSILLINVTANGLVDKKAQISKFELPQIVDSFGPIEGNIEVKNTGMTYFRTIGSISLAGSVGQASFQLFPSVILKEENKILATELSQFDNRLKTFSFKGFFLGRYNLKVEFMLDEGSIKISQTKSFVALPWKFILILSLLVIIMTFIRFFLFRKHAQKK